MAFPAVGDPGTDTVAPPNDWASKLLAGLANGMDTSGNLVSTTIKLGTNPSTSGAVRLANAGWIAARNATNAANVNLLSLNSSNLTEIGGDVVIGSSTSPFSNNGPKLHVRNDWTGTETSANRNVINVYSQAKGAWNTGHFLYQFESRWTDHTSVSQVNVSGAANNGSGLIRITTSTTHGYTTGDRVIVDSVGGVPNANGSWLVTVTDTTHFDLQGSTFAGAYTSGGITSNRAGGAVYLALVAPKVRRGGYSATNAHADDLAVFFGGNNGTRKATDMIYGSHTTFDDIGGTFLDEVEFDTCASFDNTATYGILLNGLGSGQSVRASHYGSGFAPEFQGRMARGIFDAPVRTKAGDILLRLSGTSSFAANDTDPGVFTGNPTARIDLVAQEDQTSTTIGSRMVFYTTSLGTTTIAERFRVAPGDGIDFVSGSFSAYQLRLKNNTNVVGLNNAGGSNISLFKINTSDSLEFLTGFTITDAKDVVLATGTGTKFGTGTTQKMGFYGVAPIAQRAGAAQTAVVTTASTQTTPWGFSTQAQADAIVTLVNELRAWAVAQGFIKGSA